MVENGHKAISGFVRVCMCKRNFVCQHDNAKTTTYRHQTWQLDSRPTRQVLVAHWFWWRSADSFAGSWIIFQDSLSLGDMAQTDILQLISASYETDFDKIFGGVGTVRRGLMTSRFDFGNDPERHRDPGFLNPDHDPVFEVKGQMPRSVDVSLHSCECQSSSLVFSMLIHVRKHDYTRNAQESYSLSYLTGTNRKLTKKN